MEQRISLNGKTYIVPANAVSGLTMWLEQNAIDTSKAQAQQVREVVRDGTSEPRDLLLENG